MNEELEQLVELLKKHRDRIIMMDGRGVQYDVTYTKTIGTKTDDPGVVVDIVRSRS